MSESITLIPFARLVESSTNPRKVFAAGAMAELVESIKSQGVLQPIVVRPLIQQLQGMETDDESFQVVFGHRRFRAAQQAEVGEMPCIVRAMTDSEVAQAQLHENLARADVHPIEEAEAYAALMQDHGTSADQLVQQTGKSRSYIYGRLALLKACAAVRHACMADEIGSETALLIARLRTDKLQQQALAKIKGKGLSLTDGGKTSFRRIRDLLREHFTLTLTAGQVIFDTADVFLVPDAGPCTTCTRRSGNAPEFVDIAHERTVGDWGHAKDGNPNLCTDPDCYDAKKRAHLLNVARVLEAQGQTVITGNAARTAVDARGQVKGAYIPIVEARRALKQLPKKSLDGAPIPDVVTIQDPRTGQLHQAMRRADLEAKGLQGVQASAGGSSGSKRQSPAEEEADRKNKVQAAELENRARRYVLDQVRARAAETDRTLLELRLVVLRAIDALNYRDEQLLAQLWSEVDIEALIARTDSMSPDELGRVLLDCALVNRMEVGYWNLAEGAEVLLQVAEQYGISIDAAREEMAYTPSAAARAPEGEGADARAAAAGASEGDDIDANGAAEPDGNDLDCLGDPTSNRRFWPIRVSQGVDAGCAGNADQMDGAAPAGRPVHVDETWQFPKQAY
jgi:ParB/RepB/Spo0J family partition protein